MKITPNYVKVRPKNKESVKAWRCAIEVERLYDWLIDIRVQGALQDIKKIIDKEVKII